MPNRHALLSVVAVLSTVASMLAQSPPLEFDVVSIKRNTNGLSAGGGATDLPDGTFVMTNQPIISIIFAASPVQTREVVGLPDWAKVEGYDLTAKPPTGATRQQRNAMWRTLFADRMQLVAHVEQQERTTFALVLARADGRLGPELKPSTLDCNAPASPTAAPQSRCGVSVSMNSIVSGGIRMDQLAVPLGGMAGALVNNRTGLQGFYAVNLTFSQPRGLGSPSDAPTNDAPDIFTAVQEQLGLKLQSEKTMVPVFVIDHIERPTEN